MSEDNALRRRTKQDKVQNGTTKYEDFKKDVVDQEFAFRESPLTVLKETSPHIRAIYHIFIVILLVLFCETVIYDLVERGKINIGLSPVRHGFGDVRRGAKLWLFDFMLALLYYPCFRLYAAGYKFVKNIPVVRRIWKILGIIGLVILQTCLILIPAWDLKKTHLALGSSSAVTVEMFRFAMKIHAVTISCGPRCHDNKEPLPSLKHYLYFLFAPTLIYRDKYPRTKKIRWPVVMFHLLEVAAIIFYNSFLWERFILPYWSDYGKLPSVEAGQVVRGMFACVLPGVISFLCGFYLLLHAWLNAWAEMLKFGDRLFYEAWWTTSQFSQYYRMWNRVVHCWIRDYLYRPIAPSTGKAVSTFIVFLVSSAVHEVILALSFGFFYPVLMIQFGLFGPLLLPLTATSGRRFPNVFNLMMWLSFFLGTGMLWSLYPMEHFARKNCPPSANDSFFIPKSWTCPEVVLKPNWKFQNPFQLIET